MKRVVRMQKQFPVLTVYILSDMYEERQVNTAQDTSYHADKRLMRTSCQWY